MPTVAPCYLGGTATVTVRLVRLVRLVAAVAIPLIVLSAGGVNVRRPRIVKQRPDNRPATNIQRAAAAGVFIGIVSKHLDTRVPVQQAIPTAQCSWRWTATRGMKTSSKKES